MADSWEKYMLRQYKIRDGTFLLIVYVTITLGGCVFPISITLEIRSRQYFDDEHREDAPHYKLTNYLLHHNCIFTKEKLGAVLGNQIN